MTVPTRTLEEHEIPIGDVMFNVLRTGHGDGVPLLFLHGFPMFSGAWRHVMADLPSNMMCYAPDLLGFNLSSHPEGLDRYRFEAGVRDMSELIDRISSTGQAIVIGHDVGGMLAYALAAACPNKVIGLVVVNGAHRAVYGHALQTDPGQAEAAAYLDVVRHPAAAELFAADDYAQLRKTMFEMVSPGGDHDLITQMASAWARSVSLNGALSWYRANTFERPNPATIEGPAALPESALQQDRIVMPHLLIWGTPDPYLYDVNNRLVAGLCDQFERMDLPGMGHAPHLTRPDLVAEAITRFATKVLPGASGT